MTGRSRQAHTPPSREVQPRDGDDVADSTEHVDRIERHTRPGDDAAGMGTGDTDRPDPRGD